jgi:hypothetical protein|tara:strand:+ start:7821 stop:8081 length:261 start_codon:yes stop_codon:yes gene_type:complete
MLVDSVTITTEDFENSNYLNIHDCALAKALKRKYPKQRVVVGGRSFNIGNINILISYEASIYIKCRSGRANQESLVVEYDTSELSK